MSDYIDTREGWRPLGDGEVANGDWVQRYDKAACSYTTWVREVPVPPLPTEPYTVIRVTLTSGIENEYVRENGRWWEVNGDHYLDDGDINGFEVLAEPRAVTAKAVLDRVRVHDHEALSTFQASLDRIAREFEVQS